MQHSSFEVSIDPSRTDSFVLVSNEFIRGNLLPYYGRNIPFVVPLRISDGHKNTYVGCLAHRPHNFAAFKLIISVTMATSLGVTNGAIVQCTAVFKFAKAATVLVRPSSVDESEVVEQNALRIEAQLLRQVQVVFPAMTLDVAVFDGVNAKMVVERIEDREGHEVTSGCAVMAEGTEFVVATRTRHVEQSGAPTWSVLRCHTWRKEKGFNNDATAGDANVEAVSLYMNPSTAARHHWSEGLVMGFWDLAKASQLLESKEVTSSFLRSNALKAPIRLVEGMEDGVCTSPAFIQASNIVVFPTLDENIPTATDRDCPSASTSPFSNQIPYESVVEVHGTAPQELREHLVCWFEEIKKLGPHHSKYGSNGNVLLCGGSGTGKTAIVGAVLNELHGVHINVVQCKAEKLLASLQRALVECVMCAPAVLVLDNFDAVAPAQKEESVLSVTGATKAILEGTLRCFTEALSLCGAASVLVVATCANRQCVNEGLRSAYCFTKVIKVEALDRKTRVALLKQLFPKESAEALEEVGDLMGNYTPFDMRKVSQPIKSSLDGGRVPFREAARGAIAAFTPLSHTGITFLKSEKASLQSVGGFAEARKVLYDTLVLPMKHPELFARLPLKTRSGVLLYGASGCGKTFVVEAIVNSENLNCIVVNGPEVFGKYIGQSEQKIRDVFERAQAAAPCVVFFDEFDSVAPQRGVDNSGVTDRVVNQLLCYLDGVESRKDVYVVAASSRPDLIDAALLRPGRLDKAVHCPIPSLEDRVNILTICFEQLQAELTLPEIKEIAEQTINWTPADLNGLASSASMVVNRRIIEKLSKRCEEREVEHNFAVLNVGKGTTREKIEDILRPSAAAAAREEALNVANRITIKDVRQAMGMTKPSLTKEHIWEQERIHRLFSKQEKSSTREVGRKLTQR
ncbi:peroxisome biogenesis factor 1 [Trypanosoma brucei equiperdum]|uniref:Peroxisomal ATPase PEX1 n=1 Tax=Trypanosoma brucei equiperdum TaxID=630700 RepID=A0A3L6LCK3_9TRYP|nr:peroxisome biogenesis factor 1 [Trypanosoma brucei equiperdum]